MTPSLLGSFSTRVRDEALAALDLGVVPATTHEALDRVDGVGRVGHGLALGQLADESLAGLGEGDDRRDRPAALSRCDDGRLAALHDGNDGVRRAEVDADDLAHVDGCSLSVSGQVGESVSVVCRRGGDGHEGRPDDAVAESIAAPDLLDDLALGLVGVRDVGDRLVLARVERPARATHRSGSRPRSRAGAAACGRWRRCPRTRGRRRSSPGAPRWRDRSRRRRPGPCG